MRFQLILPQNSRKAFISMPTSFLPTTSVTHDSKIRLPVEIQIKVLSCFVDNLIQGKPVLLVLYVHIASDKRAIDGYVGFGASHFFQTESAEVVAMREMKAVMSALPGFHSEIFDILQSKRAKFENLVQQEQGLDRNVQVRMAHLTQKMGYVNYLVGVWMACTTKLPASGW